MLTMLWTISLTDVKMTKNLEVTIFLILYCSTVIWLRWIFSVFAFSKAVKRKLKCFMFSTFTDEASIYFNLNQEMKKKLFRIYVLWLFWSYTAGRLLELILMLELVSIRHILILTFSPFSLQYMWVNIRFCFLQYWADENLNYPIYFLTYVASSTIDYVKSFLEWMSDTIAKSFEKTRENIFLLK